MGWLHNLTHLHYIAEPPPGAEFGVLLRCRPRFAVFALGYVEYRRTDGTSILVDEDRMLRLARCDTENELKVLLRYWNSLPADLTPDGRVT